MTVTVTAGGHELMRDISQVDGAPVPRNWDRAESKDVLQDQLP
jgi:hypothetical protein